MTEKLKLNVPKGYFPGRYIKHELEYFVLQPLRAQMGLSIEEELTLDILKNKSVGLQKVYIFVHEPRITKWFSSSDIKRYLQQGPEQELKLLYKEGIINVVETKQWSKGFIFLRWVRRPLKF